MSARAQRFWQVQDEFDKLAQEMRPTRHGPVTAEEFLRKAETLPGYSDFVSDSEKLRHWLVDQRRLAMLHRIDPRFTSELPDSTGTKIGPGFDSAKALAFLRSYPEEFTKVIS